MMDEPLPVISIIPLREAREATQKVKRRLDESLVEHWKKEGFSNSSIAEIMEIPENEVRSILKEK